MLAVSNWAKSKCKQIGQVIGNCWPKSTSGRKKAAWGNHLIQTKGSFQDLNLDQEEEEKKKKKKARFQRSSIKAKKSSLDRIGESVSAQGPMLV